MDRDDVQTVGQEVSSSLEATYSVVAPLEQTRLATSDLHYLVLKSMIPNASFKAQLALIDSALRSLMDGIRTAKQPVVYAAQVQKFINEAKRIAKASKNPRYKHTLDCSIWTGVGVVHCSNLWI